MTECKSNQNYHHPQHAAQEGTQYDDECPFRLYFLFGDNGRVKHFKDIFLIDFGEHQGFGLLFYQLIKDFLHIGNGSLGELFGQIGDIAF